MNKCFKSLCILIIFCNLNTICLCAYSESLALDYAYASALAYCDADDIMEENCKAASIMTESVGITPIFATQNGGFISPIIMAIMLRREKKEIIIGFSGTKHPGQLVDEILNIAPKPYGIHNIEGAKVFGYFYDHYVNQFRNTFLDQLKKLTREYQGYKIVFTGHSLGGALALHAAADAILSNLVSQNPVYLYTFGQPRVGNLEFNEAFIGQIAEYYRLVHHKDMVASLPPCVTDLRYGCIKHGPISPIFPYHPPTEVFYDAGMKNYRICSSDDGEDRTCSDREISDNIDQHIHYFGHDLGRFHEMEIDEIRGKEYLLKSE